RMLEAQIDERRVLAVAWPEADRHADAGHDLEPALHGPGVAKAGAEEKRLPDLDRVLAGHRLGARPESLAQDVPLGPGQVDDARAGVRDDESGPVAPRVPRLGRPEDAGVAVSDEPIREDDADGDPDLESHGAGPQTLRVASRRKEDGEPRGHRDLCIS